MEADAAVSHTRAVLVQQKPAAASAVSRIPAIARRTRHVTRQAATAAVAILVVMTVHYTLIDVKVVAVVAARTCP